MLKRSMAVAALVLGCSSVGWAGPIIIGGDDLNEHGSRSGNTNVLGWLYIQNALAGIDAQVTRPGAYTADVAVVGAALPAVFPSFDAGGAAASATNVLGLTTQ